MKRIITIGLILLGVLLFTSCGTQRANCPAYPEPMYHGSIDNQVDINDVESYNL